LNTRHFAEAIMTRFRGLLAMAAMLLLAACADNPYATFYHPFGGGGATDGMIAFTGEPQLIRSSGDLARDSEKLFEEGYAVIGRASFNGGLGETAQVLAQAKAVHASQVVMLTAYQSTETGTQVISTPTETTTDIEGRLDNGQPYTGTTTAYGSQLSYIPYSVRRYDQTATFFAPLARVGFGILIGDVPAKLRQEIGLNAGRMIVAVRRESPAFRANLVPGDVLLAVNDQPVFTDHDASALLVAGTGRTNQVTFWRLGQSHTIAVDMPASW